MSPFTEAVTQIYESPSIDVQETLRKLSADYAVLDPVGPLPEDIQLPQEGLQQGLVEELRVVGKALVDEQDHRPSREEIGSAVFLIKLAACSGVDFGEVIESSGIVDSLQTGLGGFWDDLSYVELGALASLDEVNPLEDTVSEDLCRVADTACEHLLSDWEGTEEEVLSTIEIPGGAPRLVRLHESLPRGVRRRLFEASLDASIASVRLFTRKKMQEELPPVEEGEESVEFVRNPYRKNICEIIKDGIAQFQRNNPGVEVYYPKGPQRRVEVSDIFGAPKVRDLLACMHEEKSAKDVLRKTLKVLDVEGEDVYVEEIADVLEASGFSVAATVVRRAEDYKEVGSSLFWPTNPFEVHALQERESGRVCPLSDMLEIGLNESGGNLRVALYTVASGLKSWVQHRARLRGEAAEMRNSLLDELSEFTGFNQLPIEEPEDVNGVNYEYSLENRLGLPYHAFYLVAEVADFSPEVILSMLAVEYVSHFTWQGLAKLLADLRVARELYTIQDIVRQYEVDIPSGREDVVNYCLPPSIAEE